jgi:hypothetical protein
MRSVTPFKPDGIPVLDGLHLLLCSFALHRAGNGHGNGARLDDRVGIAGTLFTEQSLRFSVGFGQREPALLDELPKYLGCTNQGFR